MNIPSKYLKDKYLYSKKLSFYQKLVSRYQKAYKIFSSKPNKEKYKNKVLKWLFSFNLENRKIICSVENKLYTKLLHKGYIVHKYNETFKLKEDEETIVPKDPDPRYKRDGNTIHEQILNEIMFYQCESPFSEDNSYHSYFTLSNDILQNQELFIHYFDEISGKQSFKFPIKTIREDETKNSIFQLPDWINPDKYYLLSEHIIGIIEQCISIKYILSFNGKDAFDEVLTSCYLNDLMKRQNYLEEFIMQYNIEEIYFKFEIKEIIDAIYKEKELNHNSEEYENVYRTIIKFKEINNSYNEFSNYVTFISIGQLKGIEDVLRRKIFERILEKYQEKEVDSIEVEKESFKKKKRKKKKKKIEDNDINNNEHNNCICLCIDDDNEWKINFMKNVIDDIVEMSWKVINDNCNNKLEENNEFNNMNRSNKKNKKIKEKKIFLYNTIKTSKIKENHINHHTLPSKNKNNSLLTSSPIIETSIPSLKETSNNINSLSNTQISNHNEHIISSSNNTSSSITNIPKSKYPPSFLSNPPKKSPMLISSTTNSITISSSSSQHHLPTFPSLSNEIILTQNPKNTLTETLNRDMDIFLHEEDQFLKLLRKAKLLIRDYLTQITSTIYPESSLQIYGSTFFELDIESSDLDLSITTFLTYSLEQLSLHLISSPLYSSLFDSITPLLNATVPVIKIVINPLKLNIPSLTSIYTQIHSTTYYKSYMFDINEIDLIRVDITLNAINLNQIQYTSNILSNFREMIPVIKIMKRLLQLTKLNVTYKGGMSSYCLIILVFACTKVLLYSRTNKGMLFMGFLTRIGMFVDFQHTIINPNLANPFLTYFNIDSVPSILDPVTNNNLGKSLFKIFEVVALVKKVYDMLFDINKSIQIQNNQSYINGTHANIIKELFKRIVNDY